jgi:uncharacterized protein DUF4352
MSGQRLFGILILAVAAVGVGTLIVEEVSSQAGTAAANASPVEDAHLYALNETATIGYWSYTVTGAHWAQRIAEQDPDAKFLVVELTIRNNDRTASVLPPLKLVDKEGREYDESSVRMVMRNSFGPLKNLNPGVTSRGVAVFDVPALWYYLRVSGGMESTETARMRLR